MSNEALILFIIQMNRPDLTPDAQFRLWSEATGRSAGEAYKHFIEVRAWTMN